MVMKNQQKNKIMGLFNKKIKENDYQELIKIVNLVNMFESNIFRFMNKKQTCSCDIKERYENTLDSTKYVGVYDKKNTLLLVFEINLDELNFFRYLIKKPGIEYKNGEVYKYISPIKNIELNEELSKYSIVYILYIILNDNWCPFSDNITTFYVIHSINLYINNKI